VSGLLVWVGICLALRSQLAVFALMQLDSAWCSL